MRTSTPRDGPVAGTPSMRFPRASEGRGPPSRTLWLPFSAATSQVRTGSSSISVTCELDVMRMDQSLKTGFKKKKESVLGCHSKILPQGGAKGLLLSMTKCKGLSALQRPLCLANSKGRRRRPNSDLVPLFRLLPAQSLFPLLPLTPILHIAQQQALKTDGRSICPPGDEERDVAETEDTAAAEEETQAGGS